MSLSEHSRDIMVNREIERALHTLQVASRLMDDEEWNEAAGRIYYAIFHAVSALLIQNHIQVKSHKGAYTMLCQHYVNTGKIQKRFGDFYRKMEILRERSEYDCFFDVNAEDVRESMPQAKEMIDTIAAMVKEQ